MSTAIESNVNAFARSSAEKAAALVLMLSLVGYPLVAAVSQLLEIENRWISIPFRALVLGLSLLVVVILAARRRRYPVSYFWVVFWVFWLLYVLRMMVDYFFNPEALKIPLWEYLSYGVGTSLLPAVALSYRNNLAALDRMLVPIAVLGAVGIAINSWVIFFQGDLTSLLDLFGFRVATEALNPVAIANLGTTCILLALWALMTRADLGLPIRILLVGSILLGLAAVVAGGSRGPLLALVALIPVLLWGLGTKGLKLALVLAAGALIVVFQASEFDFSALYILDRVNAGLFSDNERLILLADAVDMILTNPLAGGGIEPLEIYPHNALIEGFLILGVTTGACFVFLFFYSLFVALRLRWLDPSRFWVSLVLFQYAMSALVAGSIYLSSALWVSMAAVVSLHSTAIHRQDGNTSAARLLAVT